MGSLKRKNNNFKGNSQKKFKKTIPQSAKASTKFHSKQKTKFKTDNVPKKIRFVQNDEENFSSAKSSNRGPSRSEGIVYSDAMHLLVKPGSKWYEQVPADPMKKASSSVNIDLLKEEAENLYMQDSLKYQKFLERRKEKSDFAWVKTILKTGTLSDKVSAHTLLIQDSAVYNLNSIEILVSMINPKGKRECLMALDCLKDLFLSDLLIEEKKLRNFSQHPLDRLDELASGNIISRKKRLLLWWFEDKLKELFAKFAKCIEIVSRDTVEKTKQKAVTVMCELLRYNPEQEQFLLEQLVNKIGDPIPKVGSHVCHLLGQLVGQHRNMTAVVVQEVERLLFRPNVAERAKYYCLCFLNQLIFDHEQENVAGHLIIMYFGLFKMCTKKGEVNTKMMSALLTGVARAYPYAKLKTNVIMDQLDAMFRLVHMVSFNISVQTLMLIFQVLDSRDSVSDRFFAALYRKILDPAINNSSRQSMLLNLIFRALKKDVAQVRIKAFIKRLIQVSLYQAPNLQCGIMMLISELSKTHPHLLETKSVTVYSDSDSEEHYEDVPDEDEETTQMTNENEADKEKPVSKVSSSWVHLQSQPFKKTHVYNPQHRNPLHAGAEYCNLWELCLLKKSFHPSVSLFAHQVSTSRQINYDGDPLEDFTLIRFLDRFVYRNPKKMPESVKANVHRKVFGKRVSNTPKTPIMSDTYIHQNEAKVPVEERFIYQYLRQRASQKIKKSKHDSDVESVNSDEFEALLNNIHPEDEGKDTLDFAKELSTNKKLSEDKKKMANDGSDDELVSLESGSDFEDDVDFENDEEFQSAFKEYDEDMLDLDIKETDLAAEDFVDFEEFEGQSSKKQKGNTKKGKRSEENLFASADEFGALLEENAGHGVDATSDAFVNTDKSAVKQLAWERQRDQFIKGRDWRSRRNKFRKPSHISKNVKKRKNRF